MSMSLDGLWHTISAFWTVWCGLLRHQVDWWDPYGASMGALLLMVFVGLAVKFVRE
ncbi:MAG: hypothetical protein RIM84_25170 [Alphaproteobacteria bacterium]